MQALRAISKRLSTADGNSGCECTATFDGDRLAVDASACGQSGRLEAVAECRETVVRALERRDADAVVVSAGGLERRYESNATALLVAAGRFAELVSEHDKRLACRARREPLAAAREATNRADAVADIAATTGLAELATEVDQMESALSPVVGLTVSNWCVERASPQDATLIDAHRLETRARVRLYERADARKIYHLSPCETGLSKEEVALLDKAYQHLASGDIDGEARAPARAVRRESPAGELVDEVSAVLKKHTRGYGLLEDFFADERVSDVFVSAPVSENPVRVEVDGEILPTNVRLEQGGVRALASRFRHESGRGFSAADPTLDTGVHIGDRRVRVAGVTSPVSDGTAFAFRAHDRTAWTIPALVANGTLTARAGAVLSLAVERGRSLLLAGPRGSGKTTMLSALLWELPPAVRTVVIEDAPELPVGTLQSHGRDVQGLRADDDNSFSPAEALRTALRLGNGALVVGEVRGEEAPVLYEAMRVGANSEAVLGTIHGEGAAGVYERIVSDLGVDPAAFGATDLVVTLELAPDSDQPRRVGTVEEVVDAESGEFEPLFDRPEGPLVSTGRVDRGNSHLVAALAEPAETYAEVRSALTRRQERIDALVSADRTGPGDVTADRLEQQ